MKKLRFLISLITEGNDFQQEQAATARAAAKDLAVDLEVVFAAGDSITQSTQILKCIQADPVLRPAAVIVEPVGGTGLPQVAKAANAAGIGWSLLNREAEYVPELRRSSETPTFVVTSDHVEVGHIHAQQLAAMLPDGGSVLYILGPTESAAARDRKAGFEEACPKNVQALAVRGKWTEESSYNSVTTWLKLGGAAKGAVRAIVAHNDAMAIGARKAFEELGDRQEREKWLNLPFLGCDGLAGTGQTWVRRGLLAATVITPPMAGLAVRLMAGALQTGKTVPERTVTLLESFPPIAKLPRPQIKPAS